MDILFHIKHNIQMNDNSFQVKHPNLIKHKLGLLQSEIHNFMITPFTEIFEVLNHEVVDVCLLLYAYSIH